MMEKILKNQEASGFFIISILVLFCCFLSGFWQRPAFAEKVKDPVMLAPQEKGSAWDLPAGTYGSDEQGSTTGPGGSPAPATGQNGNAGPGGSPAPGPGGDVGPGGSPSSPGRGGGSVGPGGSPTPAN